MFSKCSGGVVEGHLPAPERDELCAEGAMGSVER
jgi:hypothetical protein